ncbi:NAD-dependent epimerase/dehydratase family protein [Aeromicrobium sp. S22]|uniref:SDR family oxidoreductase n=1 Tax=Aeromicrobium sp. S22 TaxID=2662029 RepID=UPI00129EE24B|nr:SDR family oxidoreductase [Aeromicrobium sp. S22]MRK01070.1 NAD-dependent epimerase/dehydratase family protein [Aeromicrobium sp. S22]
MTGHRVLVTGADGFLGRSVVQGLAASPTVDVVVGTDLRLPDEATPGAVHEIADVTDPAAVDAVIGRHGVDTVVHLASIVNPGRGMSDELAYRVDVDGSRHVLDACIAHGVRRLVVSSSGAAYGYHADSPAWITEDQPVRANDAFAYSRHKRLVEQMLAAEREAHPGLEQVVLRIGTILGATVDNQITDLFRARRLLRIAGSDSPFVFIWDEDLVAIMLQAVTGHVTGVFNVAGDGAMTVREIAAALGKPTLPVPEPVLRTALRVARPLRLTQYGPEQTKFLQYRPVLDNSRLKDVFGYRPAKTSREAFAAWQAAQGL